MEMLLLLLLVALFGFRPSLSSGTHSVQEWVEKRELSEQREGKTSVDEPQKQQRSYRGEKEESESGKT